MVSCCCGFKPITYTIWYLVLLGLASTGQGKNWLADDQYNVTVWDNRLWCQTRGLVFQWDSTMRPPWVHATTRHCPHDMILDVNPQLTNHNGQPAVFIKEYTTTFQIQLIMQLYSWWTQHIVVDWMYWLSRNVQKNRSMAFHNCHLWFMWPEKPTRFCRYHCGIYDYQSMPLIYILRRKWQVERPGLGLSLWWRHRIKAPDQWVRNILWNYILRLYTRIMLIHHIYIIEELFS